jgi:hypothetical protein
MKHNEFTTRTELKSLTKSIKCAETECGRLTMLKVCLGDSSMGLGVPFIAPRQLGAVGGILGRTKLPSVGWHTGQSGAPPDNHCSCPVHDLLPNLAQPTVAASGPLAHRTVRSPLPTVGSSHALPADLAADRWLTRQSGELEPYAAKVFPRVASSPETSLHHRTLSGAPPDCPVCQTVLSLGCTQALSSNLFLFLFLELR